MLYGVEGVDPARRSALIRLLDIDVYQRLNTMSDGQRRRVQIAMGLLKPYEVCRPPPYFADYELHTKVAAPSGHSGTCTALHVGMEALCPTA
jgi:hypothetical protein